MSYFSKFIRTAAQPSVQETHDHAAEFHQSWTIVQSTLMHPDERQLSRGIKSTDVPQHLQSMVDSLVWESTRTEEGATGVCLEYLLKNDVLGTLVRLSESDRPSGIQAEVLRAVQNMVVLLDEQFLVHSAVHRAVLRLLRGCVGDDIQEQLDGRNKVMGAAKNAVKSQPSEHEEDLVNLLCILCSRIRTYRELLMIFFHDKGWYRSEPLFSVDEVDEDDYDSEDEDDEDEDEDKTEVFRRPSEASASVQPEEAPKKTEYEFLLFNYLLRFVHREGQIGDFARAGLLFLMDVAMSPGEPINRLAGEEPPRDDESKKDPITEAALALAEYIVDGDFSEVLGAGLGAVYSLLPSKIQFYDRDISENPSMQGMVIGGMQTEDEQEEAALTKERNEAMGVEDPSTPDFKSRLDHFLKLLEFLQDVLRRNVVHDSSTGASNLVGNAIVESILYAVRRIFLENVLYPSILECSDTDGSAVAVMSYIEIMIRTLHEGPLVSLLIDFLISEDNDEIHLQQRSATVLNLASAPPKADKSTKARHRKSSAMMLLEMEAPESNKQTDYFTSMGRFTLKDLILTNLRSTSQATATSALHLLRTLLLRYPQICVDRLLIVISDPDATIFPHPTLLGLETESSQDKEKEDIDDEDEFVYRGNETDLEIEPTPDLYALFPQPDTTYSTHEREMGLYLTLVSRVDPSHSSDTFSTGYDYYLHDAITSIQSQPSYRLDIDPDTRSSLKHRLNANDPILSLILDYLRNFYSNTPDFNMSLTGVLATLAVHPDRSLAGWMTFGNSHTEDGDKTKRVRTDDDFTINGDGDDRSIDYHIDEKLFLDENVLPASRMDDSSRPIVYSVLQGLVAQLERYRQTVSDFDKYLLERRRGLLFSENLTDALTLGLDFDGPQPIPSVAESPPKPKPKKPSASSTFVSLFTPKKSRPATPKNPAVEPVQAQSPFSPPHQQGRGVSASPFGTHYQQTSTIMVEPFVAPVPESESWTPVKASVTWNDEEEDIFSSGWSERPSKPLAESQHELPNKTTSSITLSQLLDNVVILEECIKELASIVHARRSFGIDALRYL